MKKFLRIATFVWAGIAIVAGILVFSKEKHELHFSYFPFGQTRQQLVLSLTYWGDDFANPTDKAIFEETSSDVVFLIGDPFYRLGNIFQRDLRSHRLHPRFVFGQLDMLTDGVQTHRQSVFPADQAIALGLWGLWGLLLIIAWGVKRKSVKRK